MRGATRAPSNMAHAESRTLQGQGLSPVGCNAMQRESNEGERADDKACARAPAEHKHRLTIRSSADATMIGHACGKGPACKMRARLVSWCSRPLNQHNANMRANKEHVRTHMPPEKNHAF